MGRKNIRKKVTAMNASANPFNMKMNRQKHTILGQKVKGTQGLPGISQALSHAKQKDQLHKKKLKTGKANRFIDKKLMDGSLPSEEQAVLRLVHERNQKLKKSVLTLNEQEHLTHKGKPLHELDKYGGRSDESENEQLSALLLKDQLHKKKLKTGKANRFIDKRLMDGSLPSEEQAVLRLVHERKQKLKKSVVTLNEQEHLTHKGKPLHELDKYGGRIDEPEDDEQLSANFVKQAHFGGFSSDVRGETPKSHKEIINDLIVESKMRKQEKKTENEENADLTEKLDKDWKDILSVVFSIRSKKPVEQPEKKDSYDVTLQDLKFEIRATVSNPLKTSEEIEREEQEKFQKLEAERLKRMNVGADNVINNNFSADSIDDGFDIQPMPVNETESRSLDDSNKPEHFEVDESDETMSESDNDNDEKDADKETASLEIRTANENEELSIPETRADFDIIATSCVGDSNKPEYLGVDESDESMSESDNDNDEKDADIETASLKMLTANENAAENEELSIPETRADFDLIATNCVLDELPNKVGNILKSHLPCKSEESLIKLENFLSVLIEYMLEICENHVQNCAAYFPYLYDLAQIFPLKTGKIILRFLDQEQQSFQQLFRAKKKNCNLPLKNILLLNVCVNLYSVSDFKHPVMTPAYIFMCDILSRDYNASVQNVIYRLFISRMIFKCATDSKRFVPEVIKFLNKILSLGVKSVDRNLSVKLKKNVNLVPDEEFKTNISHLNFKMETPNDSTKISIVFEIINQLEGFALLYSSLLSYNEIFSQTLSICQQLPLDKYPDALVRAVNLLKTKLSESEGFLSHLVFRNTKPKPLKMLEPAFESKFSLKKNDIPKKRKLVKSVEQKIRREEKSLVREICRDAQVVESEKMKEALEADEERKRIVKQLYAELSMQKREYKKYAKRK